MEVHYDNVKSGEALVKTQNQLYANKFDHNIPSEGNITIKTIHPNYLWYSY